MENNVTCITISELYNLHPVRFGIYSKNGFAESIQIIINGEHNYKDVIINEYIKYDLAHGKFQEKANESLLKCLNTKPLRVFVRKKNDNVALDFGMYMPVKMMGEDNSAILLKLNNLGLIHEINIKNINKTIQLIIDSYTIKLDR